MGARWGYGGGKVALRARRGVPQVCRFGTQPPPRFHRQAAIDALMLWLFRLPPSALRLPVAIAEQRAFVKRFVDLLRLSTTEGAARLLSARAGRN